MPAPVKPKIISSSKSKTTVWKGPEEDGITQSMLSRFLQCRERFRLLVVEGLKPADTFNHHIEYGQMWHICEEALSSTKDSKLINVPWDQKLRDYVKTLIQKYPTSVDQIDKWYNVCKVQFPVYVDYWSKQKDNETRVPVGQEIRFSVPYKLSSGRTIRLRGKIDALDVIGSGGAAALYEQENKTKSDPNEEQIRRQLHFDLQSMLYLTALQVLQRDKKLWEEHGLPERCRNIVIGGIRYNVIKRPLGGGEGSIRPHQGTSKKPPESKEAFYNRLRGVIDGTGFKTNKEKYEGPTNFFMRWRAEVPASDITKFQHRFLNPILEQLCDWWTYVSLCHKEDKNPFIYASSNDFLAEFMSIHWQHPFGVRNILDEGGSTDLDEHLWSGSTLGLEKVESLFTELA